VEGSHQHVLDLVRSERESLRLCSVPITLHKRRSDEASIGARIRKCFATDQDLSPLPRYAVPSAVLCRSV